MPSFGRKSAKVMPVSDAQLKDVKIKNINKEIRQPQQPSNGGSRKIKKSTKRKKTKKSIKRKKTKSTKKKKTTRKSKKK